MRGFDLNDAFFQPLWRRVAIVLVCLGWSAFEFVNDAPAWGTLFAGIGLYSAWAFFVVFNTSDKTDANEEDPS